MVSRLNRAAIVVGGAVVPTACASSLPSNFEYQTSIRGEQGFAGRADRVSAAETLLNAGVVTDPKLALQAAMPDAEVAVRKWGLRYFSKNWARYQTVLDADIRRGEGITKCREVSTESPVGAPTLNELRDNGGAELQRQLDRLIVGCVKQATTP